MRLGNSAVAAAAAVAAAVAAVAAVAPPECVFFGEKKPPEAT